MASVVDRVRPKAAFDPETIAALCRSFSSATAAGSAANNKRIWRNPLEHRLRADVAWTKSGAKQTTPT